MKKFLPFLLLSLLTLSADAGLPPTTSQGIGDSSGVVTFNYQFPNFAITHTGPTASLGVLGIGGGGTGNTSGTALDFSGSLIGEVTSVGMTTTIAPEAVTNAKMAQMPTLTLKGNDALVSAVPQDLNVSEVQTMLGTSGTNTGDVTLGAFGSTPNSSGASLTGQTLTLQPASATQPGSMSTTTQSFLGQKYFNTYLQVGGTSLSQPVVSALSSFAVVNSNLTTVAYGGAPAFLAYKANGTEAAPTAVTVNQLMSSFNARGHDGTAWIQATKGRVTISAAENWTPTANGTFIGFFTTAIGTSSLTERLRIADSGNIGIGTTVTGAKLTVAGNITASTTIAATGALSTGGDLSVTGKPLFGGTAPALSGCGTTPSLVGNDKVGRITVGSGGVATTCTVTFNTVWTNAPVCVANNETTTLLARASATTTVLTITSAVPFTAADTIGYHCLGYL